MNRTLLRFALQSSLVLHELAGLHVEGREGLVHEQDARVQDEHLREGHALSHAAGELVGIAVAEAVEAHAGEPGLALFPGGGPVLAAELEPGDHVVEGAAPRHEGFGLEHVAGVAIDARERLAQHPHRPSRGTQQAGRRVEQRRLAATRGPDDGDELAVGHGEVHVLHGRVAAAALRGELAGDLVEGDGDGHGYLYFAAAFFAKELSKVLSSLMASPALMTDGSNCRSTL